jgi:ABC-type amino acid transport substrate-binding protein
MTFLFRTLKIYPVVILICIACLIPAFARQKITYSAGEWAPFSYNVPSGGVSGLYIDILREIFTNEMGIVLEADLLPWKRAQFEVKNGNSDFLVTVATKERLEYALKSRVPILELYLFAYTYAGHPRLEAINRIESPHGIKQLNLRPVTNLGNNWHKINIDGLGVSTHYVADEELAFSILAARRADISIEPLYAGSYLINHLGLSQKVVPTRAKFGPIIFHLLLSKKSAYTDRWEDINTAIEKVVRSDRYREILSAYEEIQ